MAVNKRLQSGADKWFPFYTLLCGEDKFIANRIIGIQFRLKSLAADWAGVTAGLKIAPVLNPLLLDEFKLPEQACAQGDENQAMF